MGFRASLFYSVSLRVHVCKMRQLDLDKRFFTFIMNQNYMEDMLKNTFSYPPTPRYFDLIGPGRGPGIYIYGEGPKVCLVTPLSLVPGV